jgi:ABC-type multidrug transport system fused ATPase/permease subunit
MLVARRADLHAEVVETIGGLADLAAYGAARRQLERLNDLSRFVAAAQDRLARIQAGQAAAGSLLAYGAALAVLAVAADIDSVGGVHLASLALATLASFEAILPLASAAQSLESALPAARRLFDIADLAPAVPAAPLPAPLLDFSRGLRLEVEGLRFAYAPEEPPALDRVSFTLPDGARVAVVGPSGAGKTTLVNLLLRFWDFTQGEILLNGIDLRRIPGEMVRRNLSVISQTTYVFHASLRENLLVARPGASPAELRSALRRAQLEPLVMSLPEGLETQLGEHGLRLSAGERQRVGIARALLRDTPLLVLDEPTANLDLLTEHRVLATLDTAMEGRTSLLITHRLVGMERPDEILVLDRGRVVERGQHSTLRCAGGMYQRLWELQNQAWAAIEGIDESPGH